VRFEDKGAREQVASQPKRPSGPKGLVGSRGQEIQRALGATGRLEQCFGRLVAIIAGVTIVWEG
jgi:hypothetical protein